MVNLLELTCTSAGKDTARRASVDTWALLPVAWPDARQSEFALSHRGAHAPAHESPDLRRTLPGLRAQQARSEDRASAGRHRPRHRRRDLWFRPAPAARAGS